MSAFHVRVIEGGKIVLPAALRRKHGFDVGSTVVVEDGEEGGVTVRSLGDAIKRVQEIVARYVPPDVSLADELIADRRAEAERE